MRKSVRTVILVVALGLSSAASVFYLLVVPALVATHTFPPSLFAVLFAAFLFVQLWMLTATYAYDTATGLYGLERRAPWWLPPAMRERFKKRFRRSRSYTVIACFLSFALSVYGFGILYAFISHSDANAFSNGPLDLLTSVYFSLVTITTVGFGDVVPKSTLARIAVMAEIVVGLVYLVFFFGLLAGFLRERPTSSREDKSRVAQEAQASESKGRAERRP